MPMKLQEVQVQALAPERLAPLIGPERMERFHKFAQAARDMLSGAVVLNVNSTATGGGVAEMLQTLLAYARGVGVDARWVVIEGDAEFFEITKRIHNHLYGAAATAARSAPTSTRATRRSLRATPRSCSRWCARATSSSCTTRRPPASRRGSQRAGATVVWRCHVGRDTPNERTERGWDVPASVRRGCRRLRVLARRVRAAVGRPRAPCT